MVCQLLLHIKTAAHGQPGRTCVATYSFGSGLQFSAQSIAVFHAFTVSIPPPATTVTALNALISWNPTNRMSGPSQLAV